VTAPDDTSSSQVVATQSGQVTGTLVVRSQVPSTKHYREYKRYLRRDFFFCCGYCTLSEAESQGLRMTIDHYEPRTARPELENDYNNLMYACDECNIRKGSLSPPPEARQDGYRFFRPDQDVRADHFERKGVRVEHKTTTGEWSILSLSLNRKSLLRLRELRKQLSDCDGFVEGGIQALKAFKMDRLPPHIRLQAIKAKNSVTAMGENLAKEITEILARHARSPLLDALEDSDPDDADRLAKMKSVEALHPDNWRAHRTGRSNSERK
jgi:5-methylcytosine-specific restriction endonuclease McrA